MKLATKRLPAPSMTLTIPGPDRKRQLSPYVYRVLYRNPKPQDAGCVMTWDVSGGRLPYQIALERTESGAVRWHCGCADAVYRGERVAEHRCKHVSGLLELLPLSILNESKA